MTDVVVIARHELAALQEENKRLREELINAQIEIVGRNIDAERWRKARTLDADTWARVWRIAEKQMDKAIDAAKEGGVMNPVPNS